MPAGEPALVAVEEHRHAGMGEQEQRRQPEPTLIPAALGEEARNIVAVDEIELRLLYATPVAYQQLLDPLHELPGAEPSAGKKVVDCKGEVIIHGRIELLSIEEGTGVIPDLSYEHCVGFECTDLAAEGAPKVVVNLVCHVQPPAVDVELPYPVQAHVYEVSSRLRIACVELGHAPDIGKALVIGQGGGAQREGLGIIPVPVARALAVFDQVAEGEEVRAAVIKNAVEHEAHPALVAAGYQLPEVILAAETGVDLKVVDGVILVRAVGGKNRRQVDAVEAERSYVVQILRHAPQRSAELRCTGPPVGQVFDAALAGDAAARAGKAVWEDLIYHSLPPPVRHGVHVLAAYVVEVVV